MKCTGCNEEMQLGKDILFKTYVCINRNCPAFNVAVEIVESREISTEQKPWR